MFCRGEYVEAEAHADSSHECHRSSQLHHGRKWDVMVPFHRVCPCTSLPLRIMCQLLKLPAKQIPSMTQSLASCLTAGLPDRGAARGTH